MTETILEYELEQCNKNCDRTEYLIFLKGLIIGGLYIRKPQNHHRHRRYTITLTPIKETTKWTTTTNQQAQTT